MDIAKKFDGKWGGRVVKVKFELEFFVDENEVVTSEQVKAKIKSESRVELGETVLNFLKTAEVITE